MRELRTATRDYLRGAVREIQAQRIGVFTAIHAGIRPRLQGARIRNGHWEIETPAGWRRTTDVLDEAKAAGRIDETKRAEALAAARRAGAKKRAYLEAQCALRELGRVFAGKVGRSTLKRPAA